MRVTFEKMRVLLFWPVLVGAQVLSVGRGLDPSGKLLGLDTVFRFEKPPAVLYIQYQVPSGYERDTLLLLVRNATGPLAWIALPPAKTPNPLRQARIQLPKSGVYGLFIYIKGRGNRVWAFRRMYIILPPHQTLAQVKAYHNTLLARRPAQPTSPSSLVDAPTLPEPTEDPLQKSFSLPEPVDLPLPADEDISLVDITIDALDESTTGPAPDDEDLLDEP